jgi:coenzyme F420 hydrogenase subunit beta
MRFACNACDDFTNIFADISFGGLGSPDKYTTVIIRTEKGKKVMTQAISDGVVSCLEIDTNKKNKMIELMSQFSQSKVKRKEDFMKKLV